MTGRGRKAVLPPADHHTRSPLAPDGLAVTVVSKAGFKEYDFAELPVAEPMQRSLAAVFAVRSRGWTSHLTAGTNWRHIDQFAKFVSGLDSPPDDLDGLTVEALQSWRNQNIGTNSGRSVLGTIRGLLRRDPRLSTGPLAEEVARRVPGPTPSKQSYDEDERNRVVLAAQREFRSAWLRINENTSLLNRWRAGDITEGSREWKIGAILDHIARTGDAPRTLRPSGRRR